MGSRWLFIMLPVMDPAKLWRQQFFCPFLSLAIPSCSLTSVNSFCLRFCAMSEMSRTQGGKEFLWLTPQAESVIFLRLSPLFICTTPPRLGGFDTGLSAQCLKDVALRAKPSSALDATIPCHANKMYSNATWTTRHLFYCVASEPNMTFYGIFIDRKVYI